MENSIQVQLDYKWVIFGVGKDVVVDLEKFLIIGQYLPSLAFNQPQTFKLTRVMPNRPNGNRSSQVYILVRQPFSFVL